MQLLSFLASLIGAVALVSPAYATSLTMAFDSLPSDQGWTFTTDSTTQPEALSESEAFTATGTALSQTTVGGDSFFYQYELDNLILSGIGFEITVTVQILADELNFLTDPKGFRFGAVVGGTGWRIGIATDRYVAELDTDIVSFDSSTSAVTYRMVVDEFGLMDLFINDVIVVTDWAGEAAVGNQLFIGDAAAGTNADALVTLYTFQQVPEPTTALLLGLGLLSLAVCRVSAQTS